MYTLMRRRGLQPCSKEAMGLVHLRGTDFSVDMDWELFLGPFFVQFSQS